MRILAVLAAVLSFTSTVIAQQTVIDQLQPVNVPDAQTPIAFLTHTDAPPTIDGKLRDACWKTAAKLGPLLNNQTERRAVESGFAYLCYDDTALYIAIDVEESQFDSLHGKPQGDKEDVWSGDEIELFIAPHGDGSTFYQLCVGALHGQRFDARNDIGRSFHSKEWQSAVHLNRDDNRLQMEIAIPYTTFGLSEMPNNNQWQFNIGRQNVDTVAPQKNWAGVDADNSSELSQWSPTGSSFHVISKFGRIYFGDKQAYASRREPLSAELVLDRYSYDKIDRDAQALLTVSGGGRALSTLSATIRIEREGATTGQSQNIPLSNKTLSFLLPLGDREPGRYTLTAAVNADDAETTTSQWTFDLTDHGLAEGVKRSGKISLKLPPIEDGQSDAAWPVRTGVPLPQGALDDPAKVQLLINGKPAPCQTSARARWAPRGSIRWLGLSFVAEDRNARYELQYGVDAGPAPQQPVTVTNNVINTGPLNITIDTRGITSATLNGKQLIGSAAPPYVIDEKGIAYHAGSADHTTVTVEEAGPVHAVVRVDGWFTSESGAKLCKYTTYYEVFAGLPHVFVDHAIVITFDSKQNKLRDAGFPLATAGDRYAFGVQGGAAVTGSRTQRAYAVQDRYDHFIIAGDSTAEGAQLAGWADAGSDDGGVTISTQYAWQRYPTEYSVDGDRLTFHLWPADLGDTFSDEEELRRDNIYKLLSAHEGPALDLNMPQKYMDKVAEYAKDEQFYLIYAKQGTESNGQGVAINEPFVITFRDTPIDPSEAEKFTRLAEKNPHAIADPKWNALTEAMGPFDYADPENYPDVARYAGPTHLAQTWPVIDAAKDYGKFNFGDVHTYFRPDTNPPKVGIHRVWLNHHYGQNGIPWLLYAFYGDAKYLDWARANNHHTMNVDIVHYEDPQNPMEYHNLGAMYHVKGFIHWGGDAATLGHSVWPTYLNWAWMMTGNRRARDVASEWVEGVVALQASGFTGRDGQTPLGHLANLYAHRWDPRLLISLQNFATAMTGTPLEKQHAAWWNPGTWYAYIDLRHDHKAMDMIAVEKYRNSKASYHMNAYLYLRTGDQTYLDALYQTYDLMGSQYIDENSPYNGWNEYKFLYGNNDAHKLMVIQKAFRKAGLPIRPSLKKQRPKVIETGRYTRSSPTQYTLGAIKAQGKAITLDTAAAGDLTGKLVITGPNGAVVDAIPADASPGLYTFHVQSPTRIGINGAEPFLYVKAGETYGLLPHSMATIAPLEGDSAITLQFHTGDKHPSRLAVLNDAGKEIASASSWMLIDPGWETLTIPEGGPYTLMAIYPTTFRADRDLKVVLLGSDEAK